MRRTHPLPHLHLHLHLLTLGSKTDGSQPAHSSLIKRGGGQEVRGQAGQAGRDGGRRGAARGPI